MDRRRLSSFANFVGYSDGNQINVSTGSIEYRRKIVRYINS